MKRLAFLSFTLATLIAPIQVQAEEGCVTLPQTDPEAELRYLLSHPGARVCPPPQAIRQDRCSSRVRLIEEWLNSA
jgi:hypothetical protein